MSRFATILTSLNKHLALPQPARSRVLLEVAGDLQAFFENARDEGLSEGEAERLAVEAFGPSSQAVGELIRVHGGPFAGFVDRLAGQARALWERVTLMVVVLGALALSWPAFAELRVFKVAGWAAWPITVVALVAILLGLAKVYLLYVKRDHRPQALRRGLGAMLPLAAAPAAMGFVVFCFDLYSMLGVLAASPFSGRELLWSLLRGHATLCLALAGTLLASLLWYVVTSKTALIEEQEAELLLHLERSKS